MKPILRRQFEQEKQKISRRLAPFSGGTEPLVDGQPEISAPRPTYEMAVSTGARNRGDLSGPV